VAEKKEKTSYKSHQNLQIMRGDCQCPYCPQWAWLLLRPSFGWA